jgi:hypothetical protein
MSAELFNTITIGHTRAPMLLHAHRVELQRELSEAIQACEAVSSDALDAEQAKEAFRGLAQDGDASWARSEIREAYDVDLGHYRDIETLMDHVNSMAWAFWRLHRAERRAYGKEGA